MEATLGALRSHLKDDVVPALTPNIENRVRKLPKPSNATQGLQPLFEAVSNAMFALEDRLGDQVSRGRVDIRVTNLSDPDRIDIVVADCGIGLDETPVGEPSLRETEPIGQCLHPAPS